MGKNKIYKGMTKTAIASVLAGSLVTPSATKAAEFDFYDSKGVNQGSVFSILIDDAKLNDLLLNWDTYKYELGGQLYQVKDVLDYVKENPYLTLTDSTLATEVQQTNIKSEEIPKVPEPAPSVPETPNPVPSVPSDSGSNTPDPVPSVPNNPDSDTGFNRVVIGQVIVDPTPSPTPSVPDNAGSANSNQAQGSDDQTQGSDDQTQGSDDQTQGSDNSDLDNYINGYHAGDLKVMKAIFAANPDLVTDEDNPESWGNLVVWENSEKKRITRLQFFGKNLEGQLDVTGLEKLEYLDLSQTGIKSLNVTGLTNLKELLCGGSNGLEGLDVTTNLNLEYLDCENVKNLKELNLNNNPNLQALMCRGTALTELDLTNNSKLVWDCDENVNVTPPSNWKVTIDN